MNKKVLATLQWEEKNKPTVASVARHLRVPESALDTEFGVVEVSPTRRTYNVLITEGIAITLQKEDLITGYSAQP